MNESKIEVWHGIGSLTAYVSHDGMTGNTSATRIDLDFGGCEPSIEVLKGTYEKVEGVRFDLCGANEREGMAHLLAAVGQELHKPADQLGVHIDIDVCEYDEERESGDTGPTIKQKGLKGEAALNEWLQSIRISYLHLSQTPDTFASLFRNRIKRPDFLVLLESVGIIAVDVKNYTLFKDNEYSLSYEKELKRVLAFERLFRIPVWYVYVGEESNGKPVWYWISALKALEVGRIKTNTKTGEDFLSIERRHFERIEHGEDLGKLYAHRMPSLRKLSLLDQHELGAANTSLVVDR